MLILYIEIYFFTKSTLSATKNQQAFHIITQIVKKKKKPNKKIIIKINQDLSQVMHNVSSLILLLQDLHGFSKGQSEMATFNG